MVSRREQALQRRESLLDASLRVFVEKGFDGASMKDIATAAGVTQGLLYHYFEGKDALLETLLRERGFLPRLQDLLATAADRPVATVLSELVREYRRVLAENAGLVSLFFSGGTNRQIRAAMLEFVGAGQDALTEYLDSRVAAAELRAVDTRLLARTLLSTVAANQYMGFDTDPDQLVDLFLDGAAARPVPIQRQKG